TERRALRECNEKVVDESRMPMVHSKPTAFRLLNLHLRENETATPEFMMFQSFLRAAAIQPPVPERKYENVANPQCRTGNQQSEGRFFMRRQGRDQEENRYE